MLFWQIGLVDISHVSILTHWIWYALALQTFIYSPSLDILLVYLRIDLEQAFICLVLHNHITVLQV